MTDAEELKKSIESESQLLDSYVEIVQSFTDLASILAHRKQESDAKITLISQAPNEAIDELAPYVLPAQNRDLDRLRKLPIAGLTKIDIQNSAVYLNSSGSTSAFNEIAQQLEETQPEADWSKNIRFTFNSLVEDKLNLSVIPEKLKKYSNNLDELFNQAMRSYDKAMNGVIAVSHSAMDMRGFIQQFWGSLVEFARIKTGNNKRREHKDQKDREFVARSVALNDSDQEDIQKGLLKLYKLSQEISGTQFGKNPLSTDREKLEQTRRELVLSISSFLHLIKDPDE